MHCVKLSPIIISGYLIVDLFSFFSENVLRPLDWWQRLHHWKNYYFVWAIFRWVITKIVLREFLQMQARIWGGGRGRGGRKRKKDAKLWNVKTLGICFL